MFYHGIISTSAFTLYLKTVELVVKYATYSNSASYLDLYLEHEINETLITKLSDKRDDFNYRQFSLSRHVVTSHHLLHMVFTCRS